MSNIIGRIFGENIDSSFSFVSKTLIESNFVKILKASDENVCLIGKIVKRGVHNPYCSTPEVVRYVNDDYSFEKDTLYTYQVNSIGTINDKKISRIMVPAIPGSAVYDVSDDDLKIVYGIDNTGVEIGYLNEASKCKVNIDVNRFFNPHLFVVGKTGSGKSYFVEKLLSKVNEKYWVFSPTDEYNPIANSTGCQVVNEFIIPWDIHSLSFYLDLNISEETILSNVSFPSDESFSVKQIVEKIKTRKVNTSRQVAFDFADRSDEEELPRAANTLIKKLRGINSISFSKNISIRELIEKSVVFDLTNFNQLEQECIISSLLFRLRNYLLSNKEERAKHLIVVEEAHNYMPSERNTKCKGELVKMAREGRKFGASLCFVTQRPRFFDQTALAQSGNKVVFALSNPDDIRHVIEDAAYYDNSLLWKIPKQRLGECIIVGDAFNDIVEMTVEPY